MTNNSPSIANVVVGMASGSQGPTGATGTPGCKGAGGGGGGLAGLSRIASVSGSYTTITGTQISNITSATIGAHNDVRRLDPKISDDMAFRMPSGKVASVSHAELIKYIGERDLRQNNELARSLWDRYQAAVKLIWSDDDEQET